MVALTKKSIDTDWLINAALGRTTPSEQPRFLDDLHSYQREIATHPARFKVLACGRRFGKTTLAVRLLGEYARTTGKPYAYFGPTYKMLSDVWREMKLTLQPVITRKWEQEHRLELIGGGLIDCWSLENPDATRGRKYAGVVVDEAAMIRHLEDAWNAVIRPTLSDYTGWGLLPSTPRGRGFFWQLYQRGIDPENQEWKSWSYPTTANPYIKPSEVEAARQELPELIFRQEYLAEFLEHEGTVFRKVRDAATLQPAQPYAGEFVAGLDWAQQYDFTVMIVMDKATRKQVDVMRMNQLDWALQRERIKAMQDKWRCKKIITELNAIGSPNFEALQRDGLPVVGFTTTAQSKPPLIESLVLAFERGEINIFNDPLLIGELEAYERKVNPTTNRSSYSAPEGMHDDMVMALALAWHGVVSAPAEVEMSANPFWR